MNGRAKWEENGENGKRKRSEEDSQERMQEFAPVRSIFECRWRVAISVIKTQNRDCNSVYKW